MLLTGNYSFHTLFLQPELWHKQSFSSRVNRQDKIGTLPLSQIEILFLKPLGYWMCWGWHLCHLWYLGHWLYFPKGAVAGYYPTGLVGVLWLCPLYSACVHPHTVADTCSGYAGMVASQGLGAAFLTVQKWLMILLSWAVWGWVKSEVWSTFKLGMQTWGDGFKGSFNAKHLS